VTAEPEISITMTDSIEIPTANLGFRPRRNQRKCVRETATANDNGKWQYSRFRHPYCYYLLILFSRSPWLKISDLPSEYRPCHVFGNISIFGFGGHFWLPLVVKIIREYCRARYSRFSRVRSWKKIHFVIFPIKHLEVFYSKRNKCINRCAING